MKPGRLASLAAMTGALLLMLAGGPAHGADGRAGAAILGALRVTKTSNLDFGTLLSPNRPGIVRVRADGSRTCSGALVCTGATSAAGFTVLGRPGERVEIDLDRGSVQLTNGDGARMTATLFRSHPWVRLDGGEGQFQISGMLSVNANQPTGLYRGSFAVMVHYD